MQSSQSMYNLSSVSSPQYVPSHLRQTTSRPYASPLPKSSPPHLRRSSTVSRFGGPSFGTPRPARSARSQDASIEDAPPTESIYDLSGGAPFTVAQPNAADMTLEATESRTQPPTLASLPTAVIIFGFPSQMTSKVLTHFGRFGQIEEHTTSAAAQNLSMGHNWMKITFRDSSSAQQAVAANGTFVGGQYMVGCVYAQEGPLSSVDNSQDDAMDIDPQTPPRQKTQPNYRPNTFNSPINAFGSSPRTPLRSPPAPSSDHTASRTPGGRKIEILSSDAIYKSTSPIGDRASSWMPGWLAGTEESKISGTPERPQTADSNNSKAQPASGWTGKLLRGLVDTIFGF